MVIARSIVLKLEFHLFKKERAWLRGFVPPRVHASLRRRLRASYLVWEAKEYHAWLERRLPDRSIRYADQPTKGLFSILTPVWDGTPLKYFRLLAESIILQNHSAAAEWVILNNGCHNPEMLDYISSLKQYPWVVVKYSPCNTGIIGGLRLCLEAASNRYVVPVDSDDWLYPDCLQILSSWVQQNGFPALLYTDEDKVIEEKAVQPYLKPDFDPVLLLNSAYIAHLGVIDRQLALKHGAYSDKRVEGSPDWDLFIRFFLAGEQAAHIPEVVYSWRMHPESTADDASSKPYIHESQRAVLQRYLDSSGLAAKYDIEYSPFLDGSADWWLRRRPLDPRPATFISLRTGGSPVLQALDYPEIARLSLPANATLSALSELLLQNPPGGDELICLVEDDLQIDRPDWLWEAVGLFERHTDTVMVGGRIRNSASEIVAAGYVLGPRGTYRCPDRGRPAVDPGYFTQMLKQRSVSAVSSRFTVVRVSFLRELISHSPAVASVAMLGAWAGAYALQQDKRIVYSPYLSGVSNFDWDALVEPKEITEFQKRNSVLAPDTRYHPVSLSTEPGGSYRLLAD